MSKLSSHQKTLLIAISNGVEVLNRRCSIEEYWYRADTLVKCTTTVWALMDRGLVVEKWVSPTVSQLQLTAAGRAAATD